MIIEGDCRAVLETVEEESVRACVTSPPYWGLRDYGLPPQVWGGDPACDHQWGEAIEVAELVHTGSQRWQHMEGRDRDEFRSFGVDQGAFCQTCAAWRGSLGLEPTPELYIEHMVEVFRGVHRTLTKDGTLWLNLGDCYSRAFEKETRQPKRPAQTADDDWNRTGSSDGRVGRGDRPGTRARANLPRKNLVGIPWRVALALQADGWWLRADIIWHKTNPMPESVRDRPTRAHEYIFLLTKSERYFYDADAIKEQASTATGLPNGQVKSPHGQGFTAGRSGNKERKNRAAHGGVADPDARQAFGVPWEGVTRNARSVWTISTRPFPQAHFATFPPEIARRCILAGSEPGDRVLDPFSGAGTTGLVADEHGRDYLGIELNPDYIAISEDRRGLFRSPAVEARL